MVALVFGYSLNAQHDHAQCGMTTMDQQTLVEFVQEFNKNRDLYSTNRADKLNVPIKFHIVRRSNGTGGITPPTLVYDQFERMRRDFIAADMNLYLYENSFNYINNTAIYENPGNASNTVQNAKDDDALNIFITENANTSSGLGTVLGFYDPNRDFIIIRITDVAGATSSLSHELGHMFSLPHTFFGWESEPYNEASHGNPCLLTMAPGSGVRVEKVDGTNCTSAADRICDTPVDFSDTVNHDYSIVAPAPASTTDFYNSVVLDWTDADGAQAYQVDVNAINTSTGESSFLSQVVTASEIEITDLDPGVFVSWTVKAFNEAYGGAPVLSSNFFAGSAATSVDDLNGLLSELRVGPNPIQSGGDLFISMELAEAAAMTISLHDITGTGRVFFYREM